MPDFKILSIDGGGIRGVYPAAYLNYIQNKIDGKIFEYFDMIVGTSTGSIIALGLALDIPMENIFNLYKIKGPKIFSKRFRWFRKGITFPKYSNKTLITELKQLFLEDTLLGNCKTRVCVPTIDIHNCKTIIRKTRHHQNFVNDLHLPVWKVALESCSAPGYFPSFEGQFIDGGLWANNPSLIGLAEAMYLENNLKDIKILSLGTGSKLISKDNWKTKKLGLLGYGTSLVDITFDVQSQGATNIATYLLKENYVRIEKSLPNESKFDLDKIKSITSLESYALQQAKETFQKINTIFFQTKVPAFEPVP